MFGTLTGVLVAIVAGGALALMLFPGRAKPGWLVLVLAWPLGLSATSSAYFLALVCSDGRIAVYPPCELVCVVALAIWARRRRRVRWLWCGREARSGVGWATGLLALSIATALFGLFRIAEANPWGHWDAWDMHNMKARFLAEGGPGWRWIFEGPGVHHPDYPLLLPCSVARLWRWSAWLGEEPFGFGGPQTLSLLNWLACLLAPCVLLAHLRSTVAACAAGLAVLGLGADTQWGALQYADFAQAIFYVWGAGVLALAALRPATSARFAPLLGCLAGASAWCKNEGLAFALLLIAAAAWICRRGQRSLVVGALAGGCAVLVLKLGFAHESSVFGPRARSLWGDLIDPERHAVLWGYMGEHIAAAWNGWALALVAAACLLLPGAARERRGFLPLLLCLAMAGVFTFVLVTTHEDLHWHVETAAARLLLQLWPLGVFGALFALRRP